MVKKKSLKLTKKQEKIVDAYLRSNVADAKRVAKLQAKLENYQKTISKQKQSVYNAGSARRAKMFKEFNKAVKK